MAAIRNNVRIFARLSFNDLPGLASTVLMQGIVYGFGEFSTYTVYLHKIVYARAVHTLQSAELP